MVDELALAHILLAAVALISCLSVQNKRRIRGLPRGLWVLVIVLVPLGGSIGWFLAGRPRRIVRRPRTRWHDLLGLRTVPPPRAPDDDPEFLRSLEQPNSGQEPEQPGPAQDDPQRREDGQNPPEPGQDG